MELTLSEWRLAYVLRVEFIVAQLDELRAFSGALVTTPGLRRAGGRDGDALPQSGPAKSSAIVDKKSTE